VQGLDAQASGLATSLYRRNRSYASCWSKDKRVLLPLPEMIVDDCYSWLVSNDIEVEYLFTVSPFYKKIILPAKRFERLKGCPQQSLSLYIVKTKSHVLQENQRTCRLNHSAKLALIKPKNRLFSNMYYKQICSI
jgi:hypothetical protein